MLSTEFKRDIEYANVVSVFGSALGSDSGGIDNHRRLGAQGFFFWRYSKRRVWAGDGLIGFLFSGAFEPQKDTVGK
jgi:hypothetical protein